MLVLLPILLAAHTSHGLWNTPHAFCSLFLKSLLPPLSLSTIAPRYANSLTSSTSLTFITVLSLFGTNTVLSVLHFLTLSLKPTLAASYMNIPVLSHKSSNLDESSAVLLKKSRSSHTVVKFHCILLFLSATVFLMIQSMASKDKNPDIKHPCFTPDLILNQPDILHPLITVHSNPSYMPTTTVSILRGTPWLPRMFQAFSVNLIKGFFKVRKLFQLQLIHSYHRSHITFLIIIHDFNTRFPHYLLSVNFATPYLSV